MSETNLPLAMARGLTVATDAFFRPETSDPHHTQHAGRLTRKNSRTSRRGRLHGWLASNSRSSSCEAASSTRAADDAVCAATPLSTRLLTVAMIGFRIASDSESMAHMASVFGSLSPSFVPSDSQQLSSPTARSCFSPTVATSSLPNAPAAAGGEPAGRGSQFAGGCTEVNQASVAVSVSSREGSTTCCGFMMLCDAVMLRQGFISSLSLRRHAYFGSVTALGPFSTYVAHVLNVLPPEPHRYLPTRAVRAARGRKSYLPTYLALET